jgi:hypothetical protein
VPITNEPRVHYIKAFDTIDDDALRIICASARTGEYLVVAGGTLWTRFGDRNETMETVRTLVEASVPPGNVNRSFAEARLAGLKGVWQDSLRRKGELALLDAIVASARCENLGFRTSVSLETASSAFDEGVPYLDVGVSRNRIKPDREADSILLIAGNAGSDE